MSDLTGDGVMNRFDILMQGEKLGTFNFKGISSQQRHELDLTLEHSTPWAPESGLEENEDIASDAVCKVRLEIRASSSVPEGESSWDWIPGGTTELFLATAGPDL